MTVSLKVENDGELRAYIKDLIKGQVLSIAREEIKNIIKEVTEAKIPTINVDTLLKEEVLKNVNKTLLGTSTWGSPNFIQIEARKIIQKELEQYFKTKPTV